MSGRHVVLVGMMASGKSAVGEALAGLLGRPFCDSDAMVEERTGRTVREIWEADGEPTYRRLESAVLAEALASTEPAVVAAAGGTVLDPDNRSLMREAGTVVWLDVDPAVLARRVGRGGRDGEGGDHRPLLDGDPDAVLRRLDAERRPLYGAVAEIVVDAGGRPAGELAAEVAGRLL